MCFTPFCVFLFILKFLNGMVDKFDKTSSLKFQADRGLKSLHPPQDTIEEVTTAIGNKAQDNFLTLPALLGSSELDLSNCTV